jgi:hypothetical protein
MQSRKKTKGIEKTLNVLKTQKKDPVGFGKITWKNLS